MSHKSQSASLSSTMKNLATSATSKIKSQNAKAGDARRMLEDRMAEDRLLREIRDFHFDI